jgi:hypothetical protein
MKKNIGKGIACIALLAALALAGCGNPSGGGGSDNTVDTGTGATGNLIGKWKVETGEAGMDGSVTFTATEFEFVMGTFASMSGPYKLSGSTLSMTAKNGTGMGLMVIGETKVDTLVWVNANTIKATTDSGSVQTWTRI